MGMTIPQSKPLLINLNVNNKTYDLPTTASAVGIDLNTGKQLYYNTSSLGWATQETVTASYGIYTELTASQGLSSSNSISAAGNLSVQGTTQLTGAVNLASSLSASGNISAAGNLLVQGISQFTGSTYFAGNVTLGDASSDATVLTSQLTASNGIAVTGGVVSSSGNISTAGNLYVQGASQFTGSAYFAGNATLGDASSDIVTVTGQLTASQGVNATGIVSASSGFQAGASSTLKALVISGAVNANQTISASGMVSTAAGLQVGTNAFITGALQVTGSSYFAANVTLGDASSDIITTTGQLTASQGLSASSDIYTAGGLRVQGTSQYTGSGYFGGAVGQTTINTSDTTQPILYLSGTDTRGGTGYFNFLRISNNYSTATNRDKFFRVDSTGTIQVINSGYSTNLFEISDVGNVKIQAGSCYFGPVKEQFAAKSGATGTVTHDCVTSSIFYHTSPSNNWTANLTNLNLSSSYATTVTMVISEGSTAYLPTAVQIEGVGQTLNWQGNVTPIGTPSRVNIVTFSILNNSGTYTVLGQIVSF